MTQLRSIDISELDFDQIKANLKTFLQNQAEFTDYDFEGSSLSVLLDVLAYNTHYNAYLANMLANEMFLDSAVKRSSAVSIAKHLGYTPASTRSARADLTITVNSPPGNPSTITLDAYTPFSTSINGNSFTFYNVESNSISPVAGVYRLDNVQVVEGSFSSLNFIVNTPGPDEKYEIPDSTIDTSTLKVTVQASASNTTIETYTLSNDISNVISTSKVYFLEENPGGRYEIYFGDGIIGKKLTTGNIVTVQYLRSLGAGPNTSNTITASFSTTSIAGSSNVNISVNSNPSGGREKETLTEIKFRAPKINAARNRAVTTSDYEGLVSSIFSDAESISVWGGEDNIPPYYGKVLISLKPYDGFTITQATKDNIVTQLRNRKVLAIQPEFIDPEYFYVNLTVNLIFNKNLTTKTSNEISTIVNSTITNYFSTDLQKFNKDFNKSKLTKLILDSDSSIDSVIILVKLQKRPSIVLNAVNTFTESNSIKFNNGLVPGTVTSSRFFTLTSNTIVLSKITDLPSTMPPSDTGSGTLRLLNATNNSILSPNIGTINYGTGEILISSLSPTALPNNLFDFRITGTVQERSHNIDVNRNQILLLDTSTSDPAVGKEAGLTINVSQLSV